MNIPEKIKSGDKRNVIFSRLNALIDFVRSLELKGDNRTIFLSKTPSGILIRGKEQGGGRSAGTNATSSYEYSGYFKLYLITETSGGTTIYKVRIADGATYQSETSVGGNSTAKVNGTTFPIASYLSGALTANTLFYLKFDSEASTKVTLESSTDLTLPSDTDTTAYYQLGRFFTGTTPYIQQDHTSVSVNSSDGIARWYWVKNEC